MPLPRGELISVNVGQPRDVAIGARKITTAIFKAPVAGSVQIHRLGLAGDRQADLKVHGGPDMAVYAYPSEHYAYWQRELGRERLPPGRFGENLTVRGIDEAAIRVGDRLRCGEALLQVTTPRFPCYKLAHRMGEPLEFVARFLGSRRLGFYLRVLEQGAVTAGDPIAVLASDSASMTIAEFIEIAKFRRDDQEGLRRALASRDLAEEWRERFAARLGGGDRDRQGLV